MAVLPGFYEAVLVSNILLPCYALTDGLCHCFSGKDELCKQSPDILKSKGSCEEPSQERLGISSPLKSEGEIPGLKLVTPGPTLSTIPAHSWPRTTGKRAFFLGLVALMSVGHTHMAITYKARQT